MNTKAAPNVNDVIVVTHYGNKLAVVTKVEEKNMQIKYMTADEDEVKSLNVPIDSGKWRPLSDADKKCTRNKEGVRLIGTIESFDIEDNLQFTIKWENDTHPPTYSDFCEFNKFVSADMSSTKSKRPRTDEEEGGDEVREWIREGMKIAHIDKLIEALREFREADGFDSGPSVSLADSGKIAASSTPSVTSQSLGSSASTSSPKYLFDLTKVSVRESMNWSMNPCVNP
jgi:hypothetical protein